MKYCTKCGRQLNDDDLFCPACGAKQVVAEQEPQEDYYEEDYQENEQLVEETKPVEKFDAKAYQAALNEKLDAILSAAREQYAETKRLAEEKLAEAKKNVDTKNFTIINYMPARLQERWSKLSDERKQEILAEAKMFVINNEASAEYFWNTRDFRDKQIELKNESVVAQPTPVNENAVSDERLKAMSEQIQRRMRKW